MESSEDSRWENIFLSCYNSSNHLDHCRYMDMNYLSLFYVACNYNKLTSPDVHEINILQRFSDKTILYLFNSQPI